MTGLHELPIVADGESLARVCSTISNSSIIALDTEFVRERTYYPELCLVQVATDELITCVDCLAPIDLGPFFEALLRTDCTWVLHSARQDLEVIWNRTQRLPANLIDTQIAGALIGLPPQLGLQGLLERLLGVNVEKAHTRADWSQRPLPAPVLDYALDDVRHLLASWRVLSEKLDELGRLRWFEEDSRRQLETPPISEPLALFERMRGTNALPMENQVAALALVAWREQEAQARDRPRRWILGDDQLLRIARRLPATVVELGAISDLPKKLAARSGDAIIAALKQADPGDMGALTEMQSQRERPDRVLLKALQAEVKAQAERLDVHPEVLATRRDLAAVAAGQRPAILSSGWRAELMQLGNR